MEITLYDLALRFVGVREAPGVASNPLISAMLALDAAPATDPDDAIPWCSAFVNFCAWMLRLPRSKSLAARSWLNVGRPVALDQATPGFDVVIFSRHGGGPQAGHVALFAQFDRERQIVQVLGGNQSDAVTMASFPVADVLGVRRLI